MSTVREATFDVLRANGMTRIFGNPGSTELPMLKEFPDDFSYVLGLQELVVVGMADGFAQASGGPAHANLHTAPGVGNAVGGIFNAQANKSPLLITAGQQVRPQITFEANLTNREAVLGPAPYVKWAHEPPRAQDVPQAIARAIHHATLPPRGPAFVSIPMDDWDEQADEDALSQLLARGVHPRALPDPVALEDLAGALAEASNPVLIAGPDIDASGGWDAAVALADKQRLAVWATPAPGGGRLGFPEDHPNFLGILPPAIGPASQTLEGHDLVLVIGSSVFPYYPYIPGPLLPAGTRLVQITSDPAEAARAPVGTAIVGDVGLALERLLELLGAAEREATPAAGASRRAGAERTDQRLGRDGRAGGGVAAGRHRGRRDAFQHGRVAQPPAPVEARELLLLLQRRARLRDRRLGRRPAGPARAPGRVRARRGLRAVRHHGTVDGRQLPRAGHLPGAAQRGVHDPQVVRRARAGRAGPRDWT